MSLDISKNYTLFHGKDSIRKDNMKHSKIKIYIKKEKYLESQK